MKNRHLIFSLICALTLHVIFLTLIRIKKTHTEVDDVLIIHIKNVTGLQPVISENLADNGIISSNDQSYENTSVDNSNDDSIYKKTTLIENLPHIVDNYYYQSSEVDEIPQIVGKISINDIHHYSINDNNTLIFDIFINKDGLVNNIEILESNFSEENINYVLKNFYRAKFTPAFINGNLVNCIIRMEIKTQ